MNEPVLRHGGALDWMRTLFPGAPEPWLDLSTGINPWPYPISAAMTAYAARLPDQRLFDACRAAMAGAFGADEATVLPAPGSEALIRLLPRLIAARSVVVPLPSYGDHAEVWQDAGASVRMSPAPLSHAGAVDILVIVNPNNPDGRSFVRSALLDALATQSARGGWLIIDEAFADLDPALSLADHIGASRLIILRSFGKFYGLAGLRLGALLGPPELLAKAHNALGVWTVNGPALAVGAAAYADAAWAGRMRARLSAARIELDTVLTRAGLSVVGGTSLFRYVEVADAARTWYRLGEAGIAVRRFAWSAAHLRIGLPASQAELERLASALQRDR